MALVVVLYLSLYSTSITWSLDAQYYLNPEILAESEEQFRRVAAKHGVRMVY